MPASSQEYQVYVLVVSKGQTLGNSGIISLGKLVLSDLSHKTLMLEIDEYLSNVKLKSK